MSGSRGYLAHLELHGIKLGLDSIRVLLHSAGNPHLRYPTVHVAGTNGKGSVVAVLEAILRAAGYRVGRFTSPHLVDVNERFLVDGNPIADDDLDGHIRFFRACAEDRGVVPTYFELCTAVAFRFFSEQKVDLALVEVGMGGRFDSTNVVEPLVCAVTNIAFEHTKYLGDTLEQIAFEKAGILKQGVPVVLGRLDPEPRRVILDRAGELGCPVFLMGREYDYRLSGTPFAQALQYTGPSLRVGPVPLALKGAYQGENAAMAVALAEQLPRFAGGGNEGFSRVDAHAVEVGLVSARWPGRLERLLDSPPVILDVAHNPAGAQRLCEALPECVLLMAVADDKAADRMIAALKPVARELILTEFVGKRHMPLDELCGHADSVGAAYRRAGSIEAGIDLGLSLASDDLPLVITGSIYAAGEARRILQRKHGALPLAF